MSSLYLRTGPKPPVLLLLGLIATLLVTGCGQRAEVDRHDVKRTDFLLRENSLKTGVVGAVVPRGKTTWFFKLSGPAPSVVDATDTLLQFIRDLRFSEQNEPTWTLPENWKESDEQGLRFATIEIPDEIKDLELTVIPLPTGEGSFDEYLLSNINRWRDQLSLTPVSMEEMKQTLTEVPLEGDQKAYVVSMSGGGGESGMTPTARMDDSLRESMPSARGASSPQRSSSQPNNSQPNNSQPKFDVPESWQSVANDQFSLAAFQAGENVRITITPLAATGVGLLDNVNRWRRQVGLPPVDEAGLAEVTKPIEVDGQAGHLVTLQGIEQTLLGAVVPQGGRVWYFKLLGPSDSAEKEQTRFEAFVRSTKFAGTEDTESDTK